MGSWAKESVVGDKAPTPFVCANDNSGFGAALDRDPTQFHEKGLIAEVCSGGRSGPGRRAGRLAPCYPIGIFPLHVGGWMNAITPCQRHCIRYHTRGYVNKPIGQKWPWLCNLEA